MHAGTPLPRALFPERPRAGINDFRPHDLRHTFASHSLMRGGSLKGLKEILGHKHIKMTRRYAHLSKEFVKEEIEILNGVTTYGKTDMSQNAFMQRKKG